MTTCDRSGCCVTGHIEATSSVVNRTIGHVGGRREHLDVLDGMANSVTEDGQFHAIEGRRARVPAPTLWSMGSVLDDRQIEQYQRDGFLVIEGFVDQRACDELKAAANEIVADFEPSDRADDLHHQPSRSG